MAEEASGVRAAIERDREELAGTVQALVEKTDIKGRARDAVAEKTAALQENPRRLTIVGAVMVGGLVLVFMTVRMRRKSR